MVGQQIPRARRAIRLVWVIPIVILLVLLLIPAFPPLLKVVLREGLKAAGFSGGARSVSGYLLTGVQGQGVELHKNGLHIRADRVGVGFNIVSLLRRELPLRLWLEGGQAELDWDAIIPEKPMPAQPAPIQLLVRELDLKNVAVRFNRGRRVFIPDMVFQLSGQGPDYGFTAKLPDGAASGTLKRIGKEFEAWDISVAGDARVARYWYDGIEGGKLEGHWVAGPKGVKGENTITEGVVKVVGFTLSEVKGPINFEREIVTANLSGQGLGGALKASATVDLPAQEYRFRVDGLPTLPEVAAHYGLNLPVQGSGPLVIEGHGWDKIIVEGRFEGQGKLLGEAISYSGTLGFDKIFTLDADVAGHYLDRDYRAAFDLNTQGGQASYRANVSDNLGSLIKLSGQGNTTSASGELRWPKPLEGIAKVAFGSKGTRWNMKVDSPNMGLVLSKPFDLSGELSGEGPAVQGQLGALNLKGTWDDLVFKLSGLEMQLGNLTGTGRLNKGQISADLDYAAEPYTRFPITVRQEGRAWKLGNSYAQGEFKDGVFKLGVQGLPIQAGEAFKLGGDVKYQQGKWSGDWQLEGQRAKLAGVVVGLATQFKGSVDATVATLPLEGIADNKGIRATLADTVAIRVNAQEGVKVEGPLKLSIPQAGPLTLNADLAYKSGVFEGKVGFENKYLEGTVEGQRSGLVARTKGYAELVGPVWPKTELVGKLTVPAMGSVVVPVQPLTLTLKEARLQDGGYVRLEKGFPFEVKTPLKVGNVELKVEAKGNLDQANVAAETPYGPLRLQGNLQAMTATLDSQYGKVQARGNLQNFTADVDSQYGKGQVKGNLQRMVANFDTPYGQVQAVGNLQYLSASLDSQYGKVRARGNLQNFTADVDSQYGKGRLEGNLQRMTARLDSPYGKLRAEGNLDNFSATLDSQYGKARATGNLKKMTVDIASPYAQGKLEGNLDRATATAKTPYGNLRAEGNLKNLTAVLESPYGIVRARGNLEQGSAMLESKEFGTLQLQGPWKNASVKGKVKYQGYAADVTGSADLFKQAYNLNLVVPKLEGTLHLKGQQARFNFDGALQQDRVKLSGAYAFPSGRTPKGLEWLEPLQIQLQANNYDLTRWGVPGKLSGTWSDKGGALNLETAFADVQAQGKSLLGPLDVQLGSDYGTLRGVADLEGLSASVQSRYGNLRLSGPWQEARVMGQLKYGGYQGDLRGTVDLPKLSYDLDLKVPKLAGQVKVVGQRERFEFDGDAQNKKLVLGGSFAYPLGQNLKTVEDWLKALQIRLEAKDFDLKPWNVPGQLSGVWSEKGGALRLETPYGSVRGQGVQPLGPLDVQIDSQYGKGVGTLSLNRFLLMFESPYGNLTARGAYQGQINLLFESPDATVNAEGTLQQGRATVESQYGSLRFEGPWNQSRVEGTLKYGDYSGDVAGLVDLFKQAYDLQLEVPKLEADLHIQGAQTRFDFSGTLQQEALKLKGSYAYPLDASLKGLGLLGPLKLQLQANNYNLKPWGFDGKLSGNWSERGGSFSLGTVWGTVKGQGDQLLWPIKLQADTAFGKLNAQGTPQEATAVFESDYGTVRAKGNLERFTAVVDSPYGKGTLEGNLDRMTAALETPYGPFRAEGNLQHLSAVLDSPYGTVRAEGNLEKGSATLESQYGNLWLEGPWTDSQVSGQVGYGGYEAEVVGRTDLFRQSYDLNLNVPKVDGALHVAGRQAKLSFDGSVQQGRLKLAGSYAYPLGKSLSGLELLDPLKLRLEANQLDLKPWNLPAKVSGIWSEQGGKLNLQTDYGPAVIEARQLLWPFKLQADTAIGKIVAEGDLKSGKATLDSQYGNLSLQGPWEKAEVVGKLNYSGYASDMTGTADLFKQGYDLRLVIPKVQGNLHVVGQQAKLNFDGALQQGRLSLSGRYEYPLGKTLKGDEWLGPLQIVAKAQDYDLKPWGFEGKLSGDWSEQGGALRLITPFATVDAKGEQLLGPLQLKAESPYGKATGTLNRDLTAKVVFESPYATVRAEGNLEKGSATVESQYGNLEIEGPWKAARVEGPVKYGEYHGELVGQLDLPKLGYDLRLNVPSLDGNVQITGQQTKPSFEGTLGQERLRFKGSYAYPTGPAPKQLTDWLKTLKINLQANNYDLKPFKLPASVSGTWSEQGGQLGLKTDYGTVQGQGKALLGPVDVRLDSAYGTISGVAGLERLEADMQLKLPYIEGALKVVGPWNNLAAEGQGKYLLPYLEQSDWKLKGDVLKQTWQLSGPLELMGKGQVYQGKFNWPYQYQKYAGALQGELKGEGLKLEGLVKTTLEGIPIEAKVLVLEPKLSRISADIKLPDGSARFENERVSFDLETAPLAKAFKADVAGRLAGELDLKGLGQVEGVLKAYGQEVQLDYRDYSLSAFVPQQDAGVSIELDQQRLVGTGRLGGALELVRDPKLGLTEQTLKGQLTYAVPGFDAQAEASGSLLKPALDFVAGGSWGQVSGKADVDAVKVSSRGTLEFANAWARAKLEFESINAKYQAVGSLQSLQYLEQTGPVAVSGENLKWQLNWDAPMQVKAQGESNKLNEVRAEGVGTVEALNRVFALNGKMAQVQQEFMGEMKVTGKGLDAMVSGAGKELLAKGRADLATFQTGSVNQSYLTDFDLRTDLDNLRGTATFAQDFGSGLGLVKVNAKAQVAGKITAPTIQGEGTLKNAKASLLVQFGYGADKQIWAKAEGSGIRASLSGEQIEFKADTQLNQFVDLPIPLRLKTEASGPWNKLVLPLELVGGDAKQQIAATGEARIEGLMLNLEGRYRYQNVTQDFVLNYDKDPRIELKGGYASGTARWVGNRPQGRIQLNIPLPANQGRVEGYADLTEEKVYLEAKEVWSGVVEGSLRSGWQKPLEWKVKADLKGLVDLKGQADLDVSPLGLKGSGTVRYPEWGSANWVAEGTKVRLSGMDDIEPLQATVDLNPVGVRWSYKGTLPRKLGELEGDGVYPGVWLKGRYRVPGLEREFNLRGQDQAIQFSGEGVSGTARTEGLQATLSNFNYSGLRLDGKASGPWKDVGFDVEWSAIGRKGEAKGSYAGGVLMADLSGDLQGSVKRDKEWLGSVKAREGSATLSGKEWIPELMSELYNLQAQLVYPNLVIAPLRSSDEGKLQVDVVKRMASGSLRYLGVQVQAQENKLLAEYLFSGERLEATLDLKNFEVEVGSSLTTGLLSYGGGKLSGEAFYQDNGFELLLKGAGDHLELSGTHVAQDWLPWQPGELKGQARLDGSWSLEYQDSEAKQLLTAKGKLLEGSLDAKGEWINGTLGYTAGWTGGLKVNYEVKNLGSRISLDLLTQNGLKAKGTFQGPIGQALLEANLDARNPSARAVLREVSFQDLPWLPSRVPHLKGRLSGEVMYTPTESTLNISSPSLVVNGESAQENLPLNLVPGETSLQSKNGDKFEAIRQGMPLQAKATWKNGTLSTDLKLGDSQFQVALNQNILSGRIQAAEFPLHWMVAAWFGSVNGAAYWTGSSSFRYDLGNPWASAGTVVGQRLRFEGGGDQLVGKTVLRFEGEQLYVDQLQLDGKGSWRGKGYWGRKDSNLSLNLENTTFTPVLNLIPNLRTYKPEGSGTLRLALSGEKFNLEAENFAFKLGAVKAQTPRIRLEAGQNVKAEGQIEMTAPYPAKAELSGEGDLSTFVVRAKGLANVPLLSERAPLEVTLGYPGYLLNATITDPDNPETSAKFGGVLFPLRGALIGRVPIRYSQYYLQEGEAEVNLSVNEEKGRYKILGDVNVLRAKLALPEGQKDVVVQTPSSTAQASPVEFSNLRIRAERNVTIQEALIKGDLGGEVFLNGPMNNPELNGEVRPSRGEFTLLQRNFILRDSTQNYARFTPARGILPEISAIADTTVSTTDTQNNRIDLRIELVLTGEFVRENGKAKARLNPVFRALRGSDATAKEFEIPIDTNNLANTRKLNQEEIYALLTLGDYRLANLGAERITQSALSAAFQSFLVGGIERELARTLGLDQFRLEASFLDGGDLSRTRFTIGKYILPEFLLVGQGDLRGYLTFYGEYRSDPLRVRVTSDFAPSATTNLEWRSLDLSLGYGLTNSIDLTTDWNFRGDEVEIRFGIQYRF